MRKQSEMNKAALPNYKVRRVWIVVEYQCGTRNSISRMYLSGLWKIQKKKAGKFLQKAGVIMKTSEFRILGTVLLTGIYSIWSIEQAFIQRGYRAWGGECLAIPLVFIGFYKILGWLSEELYTRLHNGEGYE